MDCRIKHRGLNPPKRASQLHDMINRAYRNRFEKKKELPEEISDEKQIFVEAMQKEEFDFLKQGFNKT